MNRNRIRVLPILATIVMAFGPLQTTSQARTIMASAGRAVAAADYGCFSLFYSTMTNVCGSVKRLEVPLVNDMAGSTTVKVNAQGPSTSSNVGCEAVTVGEAGTFYGASGIKWLSVFPAAQNIYLNVYVPGGGGLYVTCDVNPNGRVNTITWYQ